MFFVGIPPETGHPELLPWYYTTEEVPSHFTDDFTNSMFAGARRIVSDRSDLNRLEQEAQSDSLPENLCIRLRPNIEHIRDSEFAVQVAKLASEFDLPVELEGSVLSHAYYILQREGARVRCVDGFAPEEESQQFIKLVRDQIPELIKSGGESVSANRVDSDELLGLLKQKMMEETDELVKAQNSDSMLEELADLYEVIMGILSSLGYDVTNLEDKAQEKRARRGGFQEGWVLLETMEGPLLPRRDWERQEDGFQLTFQFEKPGSWQ
jgi:predicted house-cleaning noncanonical NTP pyrophosphatase (MazG superfamily)